MAESFVQLNTDGTGKKIDTFTEATFGQNRQAMVIADPSVTAGVAPVSGTNGLSVTLTTAIPAGTNVIGHIDVDNFPATQPISGSVTVLNSSIPVTQSGTWNIGTLTSITNPVTINGTVTANAGTGTFAISAASLPLPTGAATSANQTTAQTSLSTIATNTAQLATTQPVSVTSLPLPSGAATATNQTNVIGSASGGTAAVDSLLSGGQFNTVLPSLTNTQQAAIQLDSSARAIIAPLTSSSTVTVVQPTGTNLHTVLDSGTLTTLTTITNAVTVAQPTAANLNATVVGTITANQGTANATPWNENLAQVGGSATATAASGILKVGITGNAAGVLDGGINAATAPANGLAILTVAQTTPPSLTAGQSVAVQCDYTGSAFVKPYRRSQVVSKATTIAASTTATTVLAAQGAGIFADISNLMVTTTPAATTSTAYTVTLSDGTNSYVYDLTQGLATAAGEDQININFNPPLPATTANTAWTIANSTATPTNHITVVAVLQKAS